MNEWIESVEWHRIIAVDWDGVVGKFVLDPDEEQTPVDGAIPGIIRLIEHGFYIEIFSGRSRSKEGVNHMRTTLKDWIYNHVLQEDEGGRHDERYANIVSKINYSVGIKPTAKIYIDDRGFHFANWEEITPEFIESFRAWWQPEEHEY